ncbi:uncharacterized protein [Rutidosis leptorrhynchoides]|uniref:uncharacterized protein n=1 Tax=Rutidosis leptorrhynchoides TaxID=125765 RepID=UPI003A99A7C9
MNHYKIKVKCTCVYYRLEVDDDDMAAGIIDSVRLEMVMVTRSSGDDVAREFVTETVNASMADMNKIIAELTERLNSVLLQQNYIDGDQVRNRNGEDVINFFVDGIDEEEKVKVASVHLFKRALTWHQQFVKAHGEDVDWDTYSKAILKRFGSSVEDPMAELKNLKQMGSVQAYQDAFEELLNKVEISEKQAISIFLAGLQKEIELPVRMFRPRSLEDACCLAKLQEDTIALTKKRFAPILPTPKTTPQTTITTAALPTTTTKLSLPSAPSRIRKQLTQKELDEKRIKGLCFYCDQKYMPGHKCPQLYSLEILSEDDYEQINDLDDDDCQGEVIEFSHVPQVSLNALTGNNAYQTMRVFGHANKQSVHILIDSGSTHNFLDLTTAKKLGCLLKNTNPMQVVIPVLKIPVQITKVLEEYDDVFQVPTGLPPNRTHDHKIPLIEGTVTINIRPYEHPPTQKDAIEAMVAGLLGTGVIRPSNSPFASPIVTVKKKDGSWRMCVDYRELNKHTIKDKFPILIIEELIDELSGFTMFSKPKPYPESSCLAFEVSITSDESPHLTNEATAAFEKLKEAMQQAPVLQLPNFNSEFIIETDAYGIGIGAVLQQNSHPITYLSKTLSPRHQAFLHMRKNFLLLYWHWKNGEDIFWIGTLKLRLTT